MEESVKYPVIYVAHMNLVRWSLLIVATNLILFALYVFSLLCFVDVPSPPLSMGLLAIFFPIFISFVLSIIYSYIARNSKKCYSFVLESDFKVVTIFMIIWGIIGIPTTYLTMGFTCNSISFSLGLFIYTTATLAIGTSLLSGHTVCKKLLQRKNYP